MSGLTTALIAAAVSAVISSGFALLAARLERTARRKELLLTKAIQMSADHIALMADHAKTTGRPVRVTPSIVQTRWFYKELKTLYANERLSAHMEETFKGYIELGRHPEN